MSEDENDQHSEHGEIEDRVIGRTIVRIESNDGRVTLHFDDGSEITFSASGTEEQWLSVN